ncbi:hypothetical protein EUGRSUZ_A01567 [Eucalyptus grandis]|uniref:Uncharacterized protein n=2 Tax=Eucalyptus grandis TaxID=71139 RepID=A0ACC3M2Q0_EUCGR|nr:hypothetical protein EUGRSUZ_A01567 [Eucalyptus grandis]
MASIWRKRNRAGGSGGGRNPPSDVPPGHLAVLVGIFRRRYVIKVEQLNHPTLHQLLDQAYEECSHRGDGPLAFPCDESLFRDVVSSIERVYKLLLTSIASVTCSNLRAIDEMRSSTG